MNQAPARERAPAWIISLPWDLACIIATPLAIVPVIWFLTQGYCTSEQISLFVLAFASVGHHWPGFMRAYGERELFARYRWRFLLAPPLVLGIVFTFAWLKLHGLELLLLLWATWHVLMQTYGFLRIYGRKHGESGAWPARLDWLICVAIFAAGYVFSDNRVFTLADVLWQTGAPPFGATELQATRFVVGIAAGIVATAYLVHLFLVQLPRHEFCIAKLLLIVSTATFYWISGWVTTDLLIGVAMFEIFHAVQYYAVTWAYQRRRRERTLPEAAREKGWRHQWVPLAAFAAFTAGFGGLRYALGTPVDTALLTVVTAVYAASAWLHFYYDGFIWRVSERPTQANLDIASAAPQAQPALANWHHSAKWVAVAAVLALLAVLERNAANSNRATLAIQLASLTPSVPEAQARAHHEALAAGEKDAALSAARKQVSLRPELGQAHADLGTALLARGEYQGAADALREAIRLDPAVWQNYFDLAQCCTALKQWKEAQQRYSQAAALEPTNAVIQARWGEMSARRGDTAGAVEHYRLAQALAPETDKGRADLAEAYLRHGQALQLESNFSQASGSYRECLKLAPDLTLAHLKLAEVLQEQEDWAAAARSYARVIELQPDNAAAHYNLGLIYWEQGNLARARELVLQARGLGLDPSPEVARGLNL